MVEFDKGFVLMSGKGCPACKTLKDILNARNVEYTEFDIWENADALRFMMGKGYRSIPQLFENGERIEVKV